MRSEQPVVLVTGAGSGLGKFLGESFLKKGFFVFGQYHHSIPGYLSPEFVCASDLSQENGAKKLVAQCLETMGRIDILINNAGVYHEKGIEELTPDEWFEGFNTTSTACFFTTRAALPALRESKLRRVINIGDSSAERLSKRDLSISYHIGKTGVLLLTKSFAAAEACHGVTVNMVSPGMLENSLGKPPASTMPMGGFTQFADIWNTVEFLIRPESDHITGSNIIVGGGWNL